MVFFCLQCFHPHKLRDLVSPVCISLLHIWRPSSWEQCGEKVLQKVFLKQHKQHKRNDTWLEETEIAFNIVQNQCQQAQHWKNVLEVKNIISDLCCWDKIQSKEIGQEFFKSILPKKKWDSSMNRFYSVFF